MTPNLHFPGFPFSTSNVPSFQPPLEFKRYSRGRDGDAAEQRLCPSTAASKYCFLSSPLFDPLSMCLFLCFSLYLSLASASNIMFVDSSPYKTIHRSITPLPSASHLPPASHLISIVFMCTFFLTLLFSVLLYRDTLHSGQKVRAPLHCRHFVLVKRPFYFRLSCCSLLSLSLYFCSCVSLVSVLSLCLSFIFPIAPSDSFISHR